MTSLLACDVVGVHVPRYANNLGQLARCMGGAASTVPANTTLFQGKGSDLFDPYMTNQINDTRVVAFPMPLGHFTRVAAPRDDASQKNESCALAASTTSRTHVACCACSRPC